MPYTTVAAVAATGVPYTTVAAVAATGETELLESRPGTLARFSIAGLLLWAATNLA